MNRRTFLGGVMAAALAPVAALWPKRKVTATLLHVGTCRPPNYDEMWMSRVGDPMDWDIGIESDWRCERLMVAGEKLEPGQLVVTGRDGKAYRPA